jgi:MoaA/NifB/PqqE/SkfB family radical SAM enzyme
MIEYAHGLGTTINWTIAVDNGEYKNDIQLSQVAQIVEAMNYLEEVHNLKETFHNSYTLSDNETCVVPLVYCVIDSSMSVYPCTIAANGIGLNKVDGAKKELCFGNIKDYGSFKALWEESCVKRKKIFENAHSNDICKWCSLGGINTCKLYVQYRNEYHNLLTNHTATFL